MNRVELQAYKDRLLILRARMTGDVNQLEEHSLRQSRSEANGDLSSMPIHMADIGSDNYEQEFSLSLMENGGADARQDPGLARTGSKTGLTGPARNAGRRSPSRG